VIERWRVAADRELSSRNDSRSHSVIRHPKKAARAEIPVRGRNSEEAGIAKRLEQ
jgi:hypothetical protein